jgi:hypothetical protein
MENNNIENENLSLNDLIYLFVDGEATDAEKSALFAGLANNSTLQNEFSDAMLMKKSVPVLADYKTPPAVLASGIFSTVGIGSGIAAAEISGKSLVFWNSTIFKIISSSLISAALMFGILKFLDSSNIDKSKIKNEITNSFDKKMSDESAKSDIVNVVMKRDTIIKYITIYDDNNEIAGLDNNSLENNFEDEFEILPYINKSELFTNNELNFENSNFIKNENIVPANSFQSSDEINHSQFSVELSGLHTLALYPNRDEFNLKEIMNNTAGSIFYSIDDNHSFGLSMGRETFPIWESNELGELGSRNSITWYGISYRMKPFNFSELIPLEPYLQLTASGTKNGPFGKAALGLSWMPDSRVTFYFGYEYSLLIQNFKGSDEYNRKSGLIYSINLNL